MMRLGRGAPDSSCGSATSGAVSDARGASPLAFASASAAYKKQTEMEQREGWITNETGLREERGIVIAQQTPGGVAARQDVQDWPSRTFFLARFCAALDCPASSSGSCEAAEGERSRQRAAVVRNVSSEPNFRVEDGN